MGGRREFLKGALAAALLRVPKDPEGPRAGEEALDEALKTLASTGPEYGPGFANHGPMACEALVQLGRPEAIGPFLDHYRPFLRDHPSASIRINKDAFTDALGHGDRVGDWMLHFEEELKEAPWREVLSIWSGRLAPGLVGAATHGLIRTGQATRALATRETKERLHELSEGLGYWAARYHPLPEARGQVPKGALPSQVIESVPHGPGRSGFITEALRDLDRLPTFPSLIDSVDPDTKGFLSNLTEAFAGVYLEEVRAGGSLIGFIHSVTGPSAIRLILPHVSVEARRSLLRYGWQAAAGLYAALGQGTKASHADTPPKDLHALVDAAIRTRDEHAIKFTEGCFREYALKPSDVFLVAAQDAVGRL